MEDRKDLVVGETYRFDYVTSGGLHKAVLGEYVRSSVWGGIRWYWFLVDGFEEPYNVLNFLRRIEPCQLT